MTKPLVSVITACIPERLPLLIETMAHLREQNYPNLEHCIVFEGEPAEVAIAVAETHYAESTRMSRYIPTRTVGLGRWWSRYLAASHAVIPFQVAQWMASGDYLMWLCDDERMIAPDHISALVDLLESRNVDFVYPRVELWAKDDPTYRRIIGTDPPQVGQFTHCLYRADLLDYRGFTQHVGYGSDWDQPKHWMHFGATWAMLDRVTFRHRADHLEPGPEYRETRRPMAQQRADA